MNLLEAVADDLARQALDQPGTLDDNDLIDSMAKVISASSTTLEEAFLTAVRIRRAEIRALRILKKHKAENA